MPSWELFEKKNIEYKNKILGPIQKRIAIEAASTFGWTNYVKSNKYIIGINSFGASAPHKDLYRNFGLTANKLVNLAMKIYKKKL